MIVKKGRRGVPLPEKYVTALTVIVNTNNYSLPELAKAIGLTLQQIRKPLRYGGNCSRASYLKIEHFLARMKKKTSKQA